MNCGSIWEVLFIMRGGRQSVYFATSVFGIDLVCTCLQRGQIQYIVDIMVSLVK